MRIMAAMQGKTVIITGGNRGGHGTMPYSQLVHAFCFNLPMDALLWCNKYHA